MSDDKYPHVFRDEYGHGWGASEHGTHKIVPADAIVIERGERVDFEGTYHATAYLTSALGYINSVPEITASLLDSAVATGRAILEAAEYLRANPPVDEAEVERLADLLGEKLGGVAYARRLYLAGVRAPNLKGVLFG